MKLFLIFDQVENQIEDMNKGDRRGMNNEQNRYGEEWKNMIFHFKFQNNHENQSFENSTSIHDKMVKSI